MTEPLSAIFQRLIAATGPLSLLQYMGEANARYYASRDPLGAPAAGTATGPGMDKGGDFVTAPEISQMFGELIGLWLADIWTRAGRGHPVCYVELGPGRGTLAADALRAAKRAGLTPQVHFVESSPMLRQAQAAAAPGARWHDDLSTVPDDMPMLLVANEFLDALPVRQIVRTEAGWRERMVACEGERFFPVAGPRPMDVAVPAEWRDAEPGTILETCPGAAAVMQEAALRLAAQGGAALFIDYGHDAPRIGSTLQAVRAHRKVDPFVAPGEADLTAHVDFPTLARVAEANGARWLGTVGQGQWLRALGIDARAASLAAHAPDRAAEIGVARDRLTTDAQMGSLFKVMGLAAPDWPDGAGFDPYSPT
jgi:NADH dehydrogenase [ubiquinone] 1 alpha subcomplex assembly factor 7